MLPLQITRYPSSLSERSFLAISKCSIGFLLKSMEIMLIGISASGYMNLSTDHNPWSNPHSLSTVMSSCKMFFDFRSKFQIVVCVVFDIVYFLWKSIHIVNLFKSFLVVVGCVVDVPVSRDCNDAFWFGDFVFQIFPISSPFVVCYYIHWTSVSNENYF